MIIENLDARVLLAANDGEGLSSCEMQACGLAPKDILEDSFHSGHCYDHLLEYYKINAETENVGIATIR